MKRQVEQLNVIIHTQNLYSEGERYVYAHIANDKLVVEALSTGEEIEFRNDGSFVDCQGTSVIL